MQTNKLPDKRSRREIYFIIGCALLFIVGLIAILVVWPKESSGDTIIHSGVTYWTYTLVSYSSISPIVEKNTVTVVSKSGGSLSTVQLSRSFVRVELPSEPKDLILISQGRKQAYFGSHVHANLREALGREIMLKV